MDQTRHPSVRLAAGRVSAGCCIHLRGWSAVLLCALVAAVAGCADEGSDPSGPDAMADVGGDAGDESIPTPADGGDSGDGGKVEPPDVSLVDGKQEVTLGERLRQCEMHRDCVLVDTGCDHCCQRKSINRNLDNQFARDFERVCATAPEGPECTCAYTDLVARCEEGLCRARGRSNFASECYSPTRPEGAYDDGAVPCDCELFGQQVCVGGAALHCGEDSLTSARMWLAVEDGACEPRPDDCPEGTVVGTVQDCLARFSDCYQRADQSFCGLAPR